MTTLQQTALILDELAATFRIELQPGDAVRWHRQLEKLDYQDALAAVEQLQSTPTAFMPTIGVFVSSVKEQARARYGIKSDHDECPNCGDNRWVFIESLTDGTMVYDQVTPCKVCSPALLEKEREIAEQRRLDRRRQNRGVATLLPYRLSDKLAEARAELNRPRERSFSEPNRQEHDV